MPEGKVYIDLLIDAPARAPSQAYQLRAPFLSANEDERGTILMPSRYHLAQRPAFFAYEIHSRVLPDFFAESLPPGAINLPPVPLPIRRWPVPLFEGALTVLIADLVAEEMPPGKTLLPSPVFGAARQTPSVVSDNVPVTLLSDLVGEAMPAGGTLLPPPFGPLRYQNPIFTGSLTALIPDIVSEDLPPGKIEMTVPIPPRRAAHYSITLAPATTINLSCDVPRRNTDGGDTLRSRVDEDSLLRRRGDESDTIRKRPPECQTET